MNRIKFTLLFPILILAIACNKEPARGPAEVNLDRQDEGVEPITFTEGFESGSYEPNWKTHLDGATPEVEVLKTAARAGKYAARFKTTGANGDRRSELVPEILRFEWYRQYWLGFSFKVTTPVEESGIIYQHHSTPGDKNWEDCTAGPNSFTIRARTDRELTILTSTNDSRLDFVPENKGATSYSESIKIPYEGNEWQDFVMNFRYAPDHYGFIKVWHNGQLIIDNQGINVYLYDLCGKRREPLQYIKIGLYPASNGGDGEIYYDEIRVGNSNASFDLVKPGI